LSLVRVRKSTTTRACVFLTRTPHIPEGETVVVLPPEQADLFEYAGDIWADSIEDALGMLAKGVPGYWLERPIATGNVVYVADLFYVRVGENWMQVALGAFTDALFEKLVEEP